MRLYIPSLILFFINVSCNSIINRAYNDTAAKYNGYFLATESINEIENDLYKINNSNYDSDNKSNYNGNNSVCYITKH